jgi:hypothetical protein
VRKKARARAVYGLAFALKVSQAFRSPVCKPFFNQLTR